MLDCRAVIMLWLLPWVTQGLAVPRSSSPDWAQCQQLSRNLCMLAWNAHAPAGHMNLLREEEDEETKNNVPRIQCEDGCDPQGLKDNSQFCLQRIRQGLAFYKHLLDSDIFKGEPALLPDSPMEQLHTSLLGLSQLLQPEDHPRETQQMPSLSSSQQWQRPLLRSKILRSLQAFLAIAARVFAHGAATLTEPLVPTA
ncbi:interleukin-23 subunit alpha precursor [Mus musculus]|uniref:Interleukin-23 subunit alpha n=1 Tax=Mus musculus TaxID=10090 RepID=IL23A_MOUSE|nr:interleukin-23 subunit alpha precursor [Mus musculus]Q9EQ14.1 RecName: Full=Interleukin-23 subunit alpha; Short=IL-23 subunit alpha; Short=IL-23-A; AltName: Full=Interleukin-23 subunit p19; Short=IL-23p19; Flags: Precursor [Mus musculus]AAG37231.1 interleukin 23 p19 subunit [Mus musculus]AAH19953.1 Interleukin 23, alpha subunit p19 [Mus musculus]EDL24554.1 interleukin 23, alpha subunit p19 [Mus musculus]|eukprot:NP_112542.1 interleukin-23 subunit alpha precursor [Mus musculus]